jgi:hypothetical protein
MSVSGVGSRSPSTQSLIVCLVNFAPAGDLGVRSVVKRLFEAFNETCSDHSASSSPEKCSESGGCVVSVVSEKGREARFNLLIDKRYRLAVYFLVCRIDNIWLSDQFFLHYRDNGVVILSKQKNLCFYEDFLLFATLRSRFLCIWLNKRIKRISATFSS